MGGVVACDDSDSRLGSLVIICGFALLAMITSARLLPYFFALRLALVPVEFRFGEVVGRQAQEP